MEETLKQYLLTKYNPVALLIHGSRSNAYARERSDWDFAIIVDKETATEREIIDGANIEVRALRLPFEEKHIEDRWLALRSGNVKVLHDPENITEEIIAKVTKYYEEPIVWSKSEVTGHKAWYRSHIDGMIDYREEHEAFFRKLSELYTRSIMYWFHFLHTTWMPQVYLSLPRIAHEDPEYYELLKILAGAGTNQEKIDAAEKIYRRIWE